MNIDSFTLSLNRGSIFTAKNTRARNLILAAALIFVSVWVMTACSSAGKTTLQGIENLACSSGIHFINHSVICYKERQDNWVTCQLNGSVENNGTARASNVIVTMEFGRELMGVRSSTFSILGDLDPGEKADFKSDFFYYEPLTQYDIKVECDDSISAQPSPVPTPEIFFTSLWSKADVYTLVIDQTTPTTLYAGTETQGVFKSVDGGLNWSPINTGLTNVRIGALAIDPLQPTTLYAGTYGNNGTNGAVYKSIDNGENWIEISNGMGGAYVTSLLLDPLTPSTIYAGTSNGVFKSFSGGTEWTQLDTRSPDPYIIHLVIDPLTPTNLYAVDFGIPNQGFIKSTNGGNNWSDIYTGSWDSEILSLAIDPHTPTTLYAGTWMGIFKSIDAGENWNAINAGIGDYAIVDVLIVDPINPSILYATKRDSDIFKSTNGGENWYALQTNLGDSYIYTLALDPENPEILYAATENGVFVLNK
jgi:photosystem II stability/assembly factor-like uncharacterized protein